MMNKAWGTKLSIEIWNLLHSKKLKIDWDWEGLKSKNFA